MDNHNERVDDKPKVGVAVEPQFQRLLTIEGFTACFWEQICNFKRGEDAYEFVEGQYNDIFGQRRYKNYESFIVCRNRYLKKINEKGKKD